jgi:protein O-mannosyl-transferase
VRKNINYYIAALVALTTFIIYLSVLRNEFVEWDDIDYVVENLHIRSLDLAFFRWAFFDFSASNWYPLTWISHAVDYAIWGLNPLGHHLTNSMLHAANAFVVVFLIIKVLKAVKESIPQSERMLVLRERTILLTAGVTGLLFGLHPLHVESVAWVSERKDLLCALFYLLSIMAYVRYADDVSDKAHRAERIGSAPCAKRFAFCTNKHYLGALVFFILALLSKPMAITLPVVLLILDWYPLNRVASFRALRTAVVEKLPFLVLSLASAVLTILAQRSGGAMELMEIIPLSTRLLVAVNSLTAYLWKMILPLNLIPFYPYPRDASILSLEYLVPAVLVLGITITCAAMVKKQRVWLAAWGYYVATLIPVLGIVQVGSQSMADRYTYLPSLGPFLIMGLGAAWLFGKAKTVKKWGLIISVFSAVIAITVGITLSYLTVRQIGIWKNGIVLWTYVIQKEPEKLPFAYDNRGIAFAKLGQLDRALDDYNTAIALDPSSTDAYNNRGLSLDEMGLREKARADFEKAIALNPRNYLAYNNLGVSYGKDGLYQRSIDYFLKAISIHPQYADSYCNLGLSYFNRNQYDRALENYNKAIDLKQNFVMAYLDRGNLYLITGKNELALADYRKACDLGNKNACNAFHQITRE